MDKKTFDIIVKHKIEKVCKLYFEIQEQYQDEFEEMGELFDGDWIRMTEYATGDYEEIDSHDMTVMNRIWKTYNKYKKEGKVYNVWDEIDELLRGYILVSKENYMIFINSIFYETKSGVNRSS